MLDTPVNRTDNREPGKWNQDATHDFKGESDKMLRRDTDYRESFGSCATTCGGVRARRPSQEAQSRSRDQAENRNPGNRSVLVSQVVPFRSDGNPSLYCVLLYRPCGLL